MARLAVTDASTRKRLGEGGNVLGQIRVTKNCIQLLRTTPSSTRLSAVDEGVVRSSCIAERRINEGLVLSSNLAERRNILSQSSVTTSSITEKRVEGDGDVCINTERRVGGRAGAVKNVWWSEDFDSVLLWDFIIASSRRVCTNWRSESNYKKEGSQDEDDEVHLLRVESCEG
jgi:hypothetical protein